MSRSTRVSGERARSVSEADELAYAEKERQYLDSGRYAAQIKSAGLEVHGRDVLDLGAGPGVWEIALSSQGPSSMTWHDRSNAFLDIAREWHAEEGLTNVRYRLGDLCDLDYPIGSFDMIICRLALYYSRNEWVTLREMGRVLRQPGHVYIESPNWRWTFVQRRPLWKYPLLLLSPGLAILTRRKYVPTIFEVEWFVRLRLRSMGLKLVWSEVSESKTTNRSLWARTGSEDAGA